MARREWIGIDVGGTFTDFVHLAGGKLVAHKTDTTPRDQSRAVVEGVRHLRASTDASIAHGTTTATNVLLERRGARCALVTTKGFRDVLEIGRQNRPRLYALSQDRPPPLVPDALRFEVPERVAADGLVLEPIDVDDIADLAAEMQRLDVESVAVVFLFSFRHPDHERQAAAILAERLPGMHVSLSSDVLAEYREFERTATTVVNAYLQPVIANYLGRLEDAGVSGSLRIMQSNGGTIGTDQAARQPARLVLSGPAGGVVGAFKLAGAALGETAPRILTLDMGGTSTDVSLCPGEIPRTSESEIAGLPLRLPSVDIHTVGAGGGSIARVDEAGALRVGPASAGAVPGPVCYGRGGTQPTVTDAHLVLGRLAPGQFLGGAFELDVDSARSALEALGRKLGLSAEKAALGIIRVANASMERALRRVSVERGRDPKEYVLVPFGGAGPLHACELAEALSIRRILLPPQPGVLSALGLLTADIVYDTSASLLGREAEIDTLYARESEHVRSVLAREGAGEPVLETFVDARYRGQSYELTVPVGLPDGSTPVGLPDGSMSAARDRFHALHERRYGHAMRGEPVELVTIRVRGSMPGARIELPRSTERGGEAAEALLEIRSVVLRDGARRSIPIYDRLHLRPGHAFDGPAVVSQYDTTAYVPAGWCVEVDGTGHLHAERD